MYFSLDCHGTQRFGRTVFPRSIQRIVLQQHDLTICIFQRRFKAAQFGTCVQPRINTQPEALVGILFQPDRRRCVDQISTGENVTINLLNQLRGVTPVHEHNGLRPRYQNNACRTGKPAQPGHALCRGRHIFTLIFVRTRHKKTVDTKSIKRSP
ncbi:hypothetical protein D3C80_1453930 [compost metagenome]